MKVHFAKRALTARIGFAYLLKLYHSFSLTHYWL